MPERQWLKEIRLQEKALQSDFCKLVGLNQSGYAKVESGEHVPRDMVMFLERLAEHTGRSPLELYTMERMFRFRGADETDRAREE